MTDQEAIYELKQYNAWRKGEEIDMPKPVKVTAAIDQVLKHVQVLESGLHQLMGGVKQ